MPNWCSNSLFVRGEKEQVLAFRNAAIGLSPEKEKIQDLSFDALVPMPKEFLEDDRWYDWAIANWGCKWDCDMLNFNQTPEELVYVFSTAWNQPEEFVQNVSRQFPELLFYLEYSEPGMDFAGTVEFQNGEKTEEETGECDDFEFSIQDENEVKDG